MSAKDCLSSSLKVMSTHACTAARSSSFRPLSKLATSSAVASQFCLPLQFALRVLVEVVGGELVLFGLHCVREVHRQARLGRPRALGQDVDMETDITAAAAAAA
eukprot:CAMPEP_0175132354 /NCGR_PEP_ID=MMETSP0087-20121206/7029_1 /TAXON_ID=136419 /ORGANISM="Unknown Unknown, Strain D1" /LENGTH=103 /DNA_ID=CAMNT_0016414701 /DNA_START=424 /DNA_END=731 /DNA_ORIENTATION=-